MTWQSSSSSVVSTTEPEPEEKGGKRLLQKLSDLTRQEWSDIKERAALISGDVYAPAVLLSIAAMIEAKYGDCLIWPDVVKAAIAKPIPPLEVAEEPPPANGVSSANGAIPAKAAKAKGRARVDAEDEKEPCRRVRRGQGKRSVARAV